MLSKEESVMVERGWFHREAGKLRARRLPKGDRERKALARIGRNILGRWREAMAESGARGPSIGFMV